MLLFLSREWGDTEGNALKNTGNQKGEREDGGHIKSNSAYGQ